MNSKNTGLLVVALIVILGIGAVFLTNKDKGQVPSPTPSTVQVKPTDMIQTKFKDGVYTQEGDYTSPAGPETIDVSLTLKDGVVTEVSVTPKAENQKSKYMQGVFVENYKPMVVGKSLKDLKLNKVAGSSLTPKGFNDALDKIRTQAAS